MGSSRRLPFAPLHRAILDAGWTVKRVEAEGRLGLARPRRTGWISDAAADRAAIVIGRMPHEIYGALWWEGAEA